MDDSPFLFFFSFKCCLFSCAVAVSDQRATWLLIYPPISIHSLIKAYIIKRSIIFLLHISPPTITLFIVYNMRLTGHLSCVWL